MADFTEISLARMHKLVILRTICEILEEKYKQNNNYEEKTTFINMPSADDSWRAAGESLSSPCC